MRKRCFLPLIAVAVWLAVASCAAGETRIEVDEHGDEYELKRFYIQGRQLNGQGSKSQCVVTRRKRASRSMPLLGGPNISVSSQPLSLSAVEHREAEPSSKRRYVALAAVQLHGADDDEDEEEDDAEDDDEEEEEEQANDDTEHEGQQHQQEQLHQLVQLHPLEAVGQQQKQLQGSYVASASQLPQGVSVVASAASHANVGGEAGIVVVESQQPPKVNPSTHAVFELKPLQQQQQQQQQLPPNFAFWPANDQDEDLDEDQDQDEDGDDLFYYGDRYQTLGIYDEDEHFITEDSPVSTTAIWSTGDDSDIHPIINEANQRPNGNNNNIKKKQQRRKPNQKKNKKRRQQQQQQQQQQQKKRRRPAQDAQLEEQQQQKIKRKQQQSDVLAVAAGSSSDVDKQTAIASSNISSSSSNNSNRRPASNNNNNNNKRKTQKKNKKKKKKTSVSNSNKRRRPSSSSISSSSSGVRPMGGYRRRRPQLTEAQRQRRRRQQQKRRRQELQRRRRRRNKNRQQNGGGGLNRREYFGDEPIINCIYINKDPATTTTTTQRPFWNILGRQANGSADAVQHDTETEQQLLQAIRRNGDFGPRKRTNLKFVA